MGYRKLDQVLIYNHLGEGQDPTYDLENTPDTWYLGLAGELASEIKCRKITLPMLSRKEYDWEDLLQKAIIEAVSLRPQKHVGSFTEACFDFSKQMPEGFEKPNVWFASEEFRSTLRKRIGYDSHGHYLNGYHYIVDRQGLSINLRKGLIGAALPPKTVILVPHPERFGCLSINEQFFNFFFFPKDLYVYHIRDGKIDADA
jgi:hypothetical protein